MISSINQSANYGPEIAAWLILDSRHDQGRVRIHCQADLNRYCPDHTERQSISLKRVISRPGGVQYHLEWNEDELGYI